MSAHNDVTLSKTLSWLLRHSADKEGLSVLSDGFISVLELLKHRSLKGYTISDIERVVKENDKQRFYLKKDNGLFYIRANQGHSLKSVKNLELTPLLDANSVCHVIHGTYKKNLDSILKNGINCMKRNHIHFATGLPNDSTVTSGIRSDCDVYIYIDLSKALADGIKFFKSYNGVVLSCGINGVIEPRYFLKIISKSK